MYNLDNAHASMLSDSALISLTFWSCAEYILSLARQYVAEERLLFAGDVAAMRLASLVSLPGELGQYPISSAVLMAMLQKGSSSAREDTKQGPNATADIQKPHPETNRVDGRA